MSTSTRQQQCFVDVGLCVWWVWWGSETCSIHLLFSEPTVSLHSNLKTTGNDIQMECTHSTHYPYYRNYGEWQICLYVELSPKNHELFLGLCNKPRPSRQNNSRYLVSSVVHFHIITVHIQLHVLVAEHCGRFRISVVTCHVVGQH